MLPWAHPCSQPSACFLWQVGECICFLRHPGLLAAAQREGVQKSGLWGTDVTCENTVTRQDHQHFRKMNMGQVLSQPGYDKKLISNFIVASCWPLAQQVSIHPPGAGCFYSLCVLQSLFGTNCLMTPKSSLCNQVVVEMHFKNNLFLYDMLLCYILTDACSLEEKCGYKKCKNEYP